MISPRETVAKMMELSAEAQILSNSKLYDEWKDVHCKIAFLYRAFDRWRLMAEAAINECDIAREFLIPDEMRGSTKDAKAAYDVAKEAVRKLEEAT